MDLSERANDVEGQALAHRALGMIYEVLGNAHEAAQRLQKAAELYQELGDSGMVTAIDQQLSKQSKP